MTKLNTSRRRGVAAVVAVIVSAAPAIATDMDWWTVDGGGGRSAGSGFALTDTVGQPDAGPPLAGGLFTFSGGLWTGDPTPAEPPLFADDFETGDLTQWNSSTGSTKAGTTGLSPNTDKGES